jgi:nicotinate-nucleotide adenylyltransferase
VSKRPRLGWLGGTFDPIHCGHLDVARAAHTALALGTVRLVPTRVPPHRSAAHAPPKHRWAMVTLAAQAHDWLGVSDDELQADGPSYTIHTLNRLEEQGMDLGGLHVITGADAFATILDWKDATQLIDRCHFVVVSRPGHQAQALRQTLPMLATRMLDAKSYVEASTPSIFLVDTPTAPVSSTEIRNRVAAGQSLDGLVPEAIATYIDTHGLYRGEA